MEIIQSVGIVVLEGDKVLLVKHGEAAIHRTGIYGIPSGRLEAGETHIKAAVRELKEETGLVAKEENLIQLPKIYRATIEGKTGPRTFDWVTFLCKEYSGNLVSTEETTPVWVNINEIDNLETLPNVKEAISEAKNSTT